MSKSVFNDFSLLNIDNALDKISAYKCVSFDVFDTLIKRNVGKPEDIFTILESFAQKIGVNNFKSIRMQIEKELRITNPYVTIDEIYESIGKKTGRDKALQLKNYEIDIEKNYCQPNNEIYQLYKMLKQSDIRIIAASDMYLGKQIIKEILENVNIFVDAIYVSCECKAKKKFGKLFMYILEKEQLNSNEMIHIGDSYKSDYFGAKIAGISAIKIAHVNNIFNTKKFDNEIVCKDKYDCYVSVINNNLIKMKNYYSKFGFAILGPLVYNYCLWLKDMCEKEKINKIFFFSRDGYVLKKMFDILFPQDFETQYIYFSRKSIRVPYSTIESTYKGLIKLFPKTKLINFRIFFENFGLNPDKYTNLLKKYNYNLDDYIYYNELFENKKLESIFNEIQTDIKKEAINEHKLLKEYLLQEDFAGKVAIVDIGWHNSMQYYLEQIAKKDHMNLDMYGFYVGLQKGQKKVNNSYSYMRERKNGIEVDSVASFIGLIESVFLAGEGSVKKYERKNNKIKPVLLEYEYNTDDQENIAFNDIRNGIEEFINIVSKLPNFDLFALNGYDAYLPLKVYGTNPYLIDIKYFSKFRYLSEELVYFSNAKNLFYYFFHLKELKLDLMKARWKVGFMKELMKIKLPYYKIYKKLR